MLIVSLQLGELAFSFFFFFSPALFCSTKALFVRGGVGSEAGAPCKYELQGRLDVAICSLQRPQHQLLVLDPHVPQLLHLGLPAAL